jgi:hypothetical protein
MYIYSFYIYHLGGGEDGEDPCPLAQPHPFRVGLVCPHLRGNHETKDTANIETTRQGQTRHRRHSNTALEREYTNA